MSLVTLSSIWQQAGINNAGARQIRKDLKL